MQQTTYEGARAWSPRSDWFIPRPQLILHDYGAFGTHRRSEMNAMKGFIKNVIPKPLLETVIYTKGAGSRLPGRSAYIDRIRNKRGLEIGGPSRLFKTTLPLYKYVRDLDCANFNGETIWEGTLSPGRTFNYYASKMGDQYVLEATDLAGIATSEYDFVLSSNCIEHTANPIKAVFEWGRVLKSNGAMIVIAPNKINNFDHRRSVTPFTHLLDDYHVDRPETDLTHLEEILRLHDLEMDLPAGNAEAFRRRSLDNYRYRALHHHVFDQRLLVETLTYAGLSVINSTENSTDLFALAIKS